MCVLMAERGVSLRQLSTTVHYDAGHLSKVSRNLKSPSLQLAERVDTALGADGGLTALAPASTVIQRPGVEVQPHQPDLPAATVGETGTVDDWDHDVKRRAALELLAALGAGAAIPVGAVEAVLSGIDNALGASPDDVAEWERTVHEYPHLMNTRPVGSLIEDLTADIITVGHLLDRHHPPLVRAGLLRVSAGLSGLLAVSFDDIGQRRSARVAWATARHAADASGDRDLSVWARAREAEMAVYAGRPDQVVADLAGDAIRIANGAPSAGLARAHSAKAVVAAARGDTGAARSALITLSEMTGQVVDGWGEKNLWWNEAYVRTMVGDARHRPEPALEQALALYPPDTLGPVTNLHLMTALNLVKNREIDDGLNHAITSLRHGDPAGTMRRRLTGQILDALPPKARALPAAQELRALTSGHGGEPRRAYESPREPQTGR